MKFYLAYPAALLAILALAAALRLPKLADRPMHGDEAVHAVKFLDLWENGHYIYDPHEFHGPTLNYATLVLVKLLGVPNRAALNEADLRLVPALFGLGTILLTALLRDGLGVFATLTAAVLLAVSPAFVFYNDNYIQESLLACFTLATIGCGWRFIQSRSAGWALLCGLSLGLMHATKETSLITAAALFGAFLASWWTTRHDNTAAPVPLRRRNSWVGIGLLVSTAILSSAAFYSSFGRNPRGVLDSIGMLATYAPRAGGAELHVAPWWYFLKLLVWTHYPRAPVFSEAVILLLAGVGMALAISKRQPATVNGASSGAPRPARSWLVFLGVFSVLQFVAYSAIPYKTPWCILQPLLGFILLAGVGAQAVFHAIRPRSGLATLGAVAFFSAAAHLAYQSQQSLGRMNTDSRNPYVYAHPLHDVTDIARWLDRVTRTAPLQKSERILIFHPNPWPLPWYLRNFSHAGYWEDLPPEPPALDAAIILADIAFENRLAKRLTLDYQTSLYGLRPDENVVIYIRSDLYNRFRDQARSAQPGGLP